MARNRKAECDNLASSRFGLAGSWADEVFARGLHSVARLYGLGEIVEPCTLASPREVRPCWLRYDGPKLFERSAAEPPSYDGRSAAVQCANRGTKFSNQKPKERANWPLERKDI